MIENEQIQIFVSDLPRKAANKAFLASFFHICGKVDLNEITIHENKYQRKNESSHNFSAFIPFPTKEEALEAKKKYNYAKIDGIPIHITLSDEETRKLRAKGKGYICLSNLDPSIDENKLEEMLSKYGEIIYLRIVCSLGYYRGYAQFKTSNKIDQIIYDFNGTIINGNKIIVYPYKNENQDSNEFITTCYVTNIPSSINDDDLKIIFSAYGNVITSHVVKHKIFKTNTGIGFVRMKTEEEVNRAISKLNGKIIDGHTISCDHYKSRNDKREYVEQKYDQYIAEKEKEIDGREIFVSNIDKYANTHDLEFIFGEIGQIEKITMKGYRKQIAYIIFQQKEDAKRCLELSPFLFLNGKQLNVSYSEKCFEKRTNENKKKLIDVLQERKQYDEKISKYARILSDYQSKYLVENPHFINLWIEKCNSY